LYFYCMKKKFLLPIAIITLATACKSKEESAESKEGFFPVQGYIKSQISHVDTSLYSIQKITKVDSLADTVYIKREDFRNAAKDFLAIPDIATKGFKNKYTESKFYDQDLKKVVITYLPVNKDMEIQRQEVIIAPDAGKGDQVESIYIDRYLTNNDSTVQQKMIWHVDKNFQITTITQKNGAPEKIKREEVNWSTFRSAE
jgi:hypothetical protein